MDVFIDPAFEPAFQAHPLVLVDVGARGGLRPNWRAASRHLTYIGFEPDRDEFNRLSADSARAPGQVILNVALHNRCEPLQLNVARSRGLSSIFEPDRDFLDRFPDAARFDTIDRRTIDADSLDHQLALHKIDDVDFIKADTQGSEAFILEGASHALKHALVGVEVEVAFSPLYRGQPLFADVDRLLRGAGFTLFDVRPCYWKREIGRTAGGPRGQLVWGDVLYLKGLAALGESARALQGSLRRTKVLKAISVALLYGYADYALELAHHPALPLDPGDRTLIDRRIREAAARPGPVPSFPGRQRLAAVLGRLWKLLRPRNQGWSVSRAELGNFD